MKNPNNGLWFLVAALTVFGAGITTGKILAAAVPKVASGTPATGVLQLTAHDAVGRVKSAKATFNTISYSAGMLTIDFTSDQIVCSGFGS